MGKVKIAIIGGGVSGMISAIKIFDKHPDYDITIIEKNNRLGKKILQTGNGQCNLSNENLKIAHFHGKNPYFANSCIDKYGVDSIKEFFCNLGIYTITENNKIYPLSKQASSILDALRFKIDSTNIHVLLDSNVIQVKKEQGKFKVKIENSELLEFDKIVLSTGGRSASFLGSDGSGYLLCSSLGLKISNTMPSLVQLKCNKENIKGFEDLKQYSKVKYVKNDNETIEFTGDVLFTNYGLSGNAIFYISSYVIEGKNKEISINLCPNLSYNELLDVLENKKEKCKYLYVEDFLSGIINKKIAGAILRNYLKYNLQDKVEVIDCKKVADLITNFKINITGDMGFEKSQVTKGGVLTDQINNVTFESNLVSNLYVIGELLDIDGDCGGYNIHFAYSSACSLADNI